MTRAVVDVQWQRTADPDDDIAFLTVAPVGAESIEQVTGGYPLVLDPGPTNRVDAIGCPTTMYPTSAQAPPAAGRRPSSNWTPTISSNWTPMVSTTAPAAPLAARSPEGAPGRGSPEILGVTGHDQGGLTPDISYATYLDRRFEALLQQAETI